MTWKVIGASVTGTSHIADERGCDDAHKFLITKNNCLVVCVSDGAGSAVRSAIAADISCREVTEKIALIVDESGSLTVNELYDIWEQVIIQLEKMAAVEEMPIEEFSCTLLGAVLFENHSLFFQLGDGAIIRADDTGYYNYVCWPQNGEYANTTFFLTDKNALANLKIVQLQERVCEVALFTDGLQLLALNMELKTVHQPFFTGMFHHLKQIEVGSVGILQDKLVSYLNSSQINQRTDDDKTLVLAVRNYNK